ncbi:hypothetical protein WA846_33865, partial [Pseudomonas aeruginosa]
KDGALSRQPQSLAEALAAVKKLVEEGKSFAVGLYYRQRTYYRWDGGWFWSTSPQGPWTETDARGIPPGLSRRYANP